MTVVGLARSTKHSGSSANFVMPDAEVTATLAVADQLSLVPIPASLRALASQNEAPAASVAVVGLVKRGKSTLLNRLVGAPIAAVSVLPETAATVLVSTGSPQANGHLEGGTVTKELPHAPAAFAAAARRDAQPPIERGEISGAFRLPKGLALIDTPGISEAADDERLHALGSRWIRSGAGAALVVVSLPPGLAAPDRKLFDLARETFPGAVSVVIKATSIDVGADDLAEVSEYVGETLGVDIIVAPDEPTDAPWGEGSYAQLERELERLGGIASHRRQYDWSAFERFGAELCDALAETTIADLDLVAGALATAPSLGDQLRTSLIGAHDRLLAQRNEQQAAERARQRQRDVRVLDDSAGRLVAAIDQDPEHSQRLYAELLSLSKDGSSVASNELAKLLTSAKRRKRSGVGADELFRTLPPRRSSPSLDRSTSRLRRSSANSPGGRPPPR
jgi:hypothetical protein